ncbi:thermostable hemolysin [Rhodanobacter ginsengisoli]|uniref:Thermostable hemolysin n=1 Tax=Rhodanobacter ginsengisoli TaxID=418646 RepID=A0ABW0QRB4_9GAMM
MPFQHATPDHDPCILEGVQPLLAELKEPIHTRVLDQGHPERAVVQAFIHRVFALRFRADVQSFYPTLLSFRDAQRQRAAVGMRDGQGGRLFAEQYLGAAAEQLIGERLGRTIARENLVEVGNLALESPGDTRWAIAASTLFLHALGYRWVLFTATRTLINAFQRLGLQPLPLAAARPLLLDDRGEHWGDYYQAGPVVCAGDIDSGYQKLRRHVGHNQPLLRALLSDMDRQAARVTGAASSCCGGE